MKNLLRLEGLGVAVLAVYLYYFLEMPWWWLVVFWITPDLSMLAYLVNERVGSIAYNLVHSLLLGALVYLLGAYLSNDLIMFMGIVLLLHSSVDRIFGYGLKYPDNFKHTHMDEV